MSVPGRAGSSPYIAMAGKIFQPTHPHTHTPHLIDFINPECHLLGKNPFLLLFHIFDLLFSSFSAEVRGF